MTARVTDMANAQDSRKQPIDLGLYRREGGSPSRMSQTEIAALVLSVAWIVMVGLFLLLFAGRGDSTDSLRFVVTLIAVFMPVAMVWVAAAAARSSRIMREESARLQAAIDAMRHTYVEALQAGQVKPSVERKLEEIAAAQRKTEDAIATFTSIRAEAEVLNRPAIDPAAAAAVAAAGGAGNPAPFAAAGADDQPALALGVTSEEIAAPVGVNDFIRALNFPENPEDKEGFRALRRALQDRQTAQLVQASQDVLTMLSHDGIYMDDLKPDRARPEIWRRFAHGERGRAVAGLGGVRDRSCLALAAGRMRQDPVFRDAAHHFLRLFDKTLAGFESTANDADLVRLADTRTARAFMLLGRVTGTFT